MNWFNLSDPVRIWWVFLISVSLINILAWVWTGKQLCWGRGVAKEPGCILQPKSLIWFSCAYVLGCGFRSFFPRADVQRICLFDHWVSSVFVGRSVATVAELCFAIQWAVLIRYFAVTSKTKIAEQISFWIVPIIIVAELFSWFAVITTNYIGNTFEESLWTLTYVFVAVALGTMLPKFRGILKYLLGLGLIGCLIYVAFMMTVDVPMYYTRWRSDVLSGRAFFGFFEGLMDLRTRWIVTHDIQHWKNEIPWMSGYFSIAVWVSIALCFLPFVARKYDSLNKF